MLTLKEIQEYRQLAAQHPTKTAAKIIVRILDDMQDTRRELNKLRAQLLDKSGPMQPDSLMPFGKYKGEPMQEVPDDYLRWWIEANPDWDVIYIEVLYAKFPERAIAKQKLKLHDYITERFNGDKLQGGRTARESS